MWIRHSSFIPMDAIGSKTEYDEDAKLAQVLSPPRIKATRLVAMAMLVMLVGLLTVCTWYFAYSSPRLAVTRLAESLRKEILDSTVEFLDEVFRWNAYGARALAGMLEKDLLGDGESLESFEKIRAASWSLFTAIPLITSIGATSVNGLTGVYLRGGLELHNKEAGEIAPQYIYTNSTEQRPPFYVETVNLDTGDSVGDPTEHFFKEHMKDRKWFLQALSVQAGEPSWQFALSQASGKPYVQCGIPVFSEKSKQTIVVHSSHSADAITEYLSTSLDLKGGSVFVLNDVGHVVLTSGGHHCTNLSGNGCQYLDSEVGQALKYMESQIQLQLLVQEETHYTDVLLEGRRHFIDSWPHSFQGVRLAVVVVIPRHSFWGPMDYHSRLAWVTIPLLALGVSFVGCGLIFLLMEQVAGEMKLRTELLRQLEAKRRAEASRDAKTAFLSHMSHELRTPMACIIGLLEILMGELNMTEHQSSVRQVHRCATSLVSLLNSALDIAKVEAGKLELERAEFDLETELSSLVEIFSVQCDAKGLHISLQLSDDIPELVIGDSARVMQIFTNLIGNSIKFTSKGRIIVRGWVDGKDSDLADSSSGKSVKNQVVMRFEVDDTGPGIEKDLRERVFENFVQGAVSTPRTHGGTGLGLGIVRSLVHLMGGAIKIGDKTGDGTVFQFSLAFDIPTNVKSSKLRVMKIREIVLGMADKDCRLGVSQWMEARGLSVHEASSWEDISLHLEDKEGVLPRRIPEAKPHVQEVVGGDLKRLQTRFGRDTVLLRSKSENRLERPVLILDVDLLPHFLDERDYLEAFEKLGFAVTNSSHKSNETPDIGEFNRNFRKSANFQALVWVTASNTPGNLKRLLKSLSRSIIVRRPLHPWRLRDLFSQLDTREQDFFSEDGISQYRSPSGPSVDIAKKLWVELYPGDEGCCLESFRNGERFSCEGGVFPAEEMKLETEVVSKFARGVSQPNRTAILVRSKSDDARQYPGKSEQVPVKPLDNLKILVAEDHPLLQRLACTMLRKLGAIPFEVSNGREALKSVVGRFENKEPPFHCILMDCQMPIMDGYDACKAVREFEQELEQHTTIIALTANAMSSDEQRCFQVGMDAFLSKPIQQEHLVHVMLSTLNPNDKASQELVVTKVAPE